MGNYTVGDAARILKVSPARLRYWERTELVPSRADAGEQAIFEFRDLVCIRGILTLLEQGIPLRRIRSNVELLRVRLPDLDDPLGSLRVWVEGSERVVIRHDGTLQEPSGQLVLDFGLDAQADGVAVTPIATHEERERRAEEIAAECFELGCQLDGDPSTYAEAIEAYRRGIELDPDFADCHCNLGAVHYNRGERKPARRSFERCLEIDDQHVEANFNLANLLEEEGCEDMALHHYRAALAADPLYPDLHINLALLYEKRGMQDQGDLHWRRYLVLDPEGAWADVARQRLSEHRR